MSVRRVIGVLPLVALLVGALSCGATVPHTLRGQRTTKAATGDWLQSMVALSTPTGVFRIDRFEVSEPVPGSYLPLRNVRPLGNVSRDEAASACARFGRRLCTRFEWRNACLGSQRRRYGYGNRPEVKRCNLNSEAPLAAGQKVQCQTGNGLFDMLGNVMEWVSDDDSGRWVAVGGSHRSGQSTDCFTEHFFAQGTQEEQIGFRCCL